MINIIDTVERVRATVALQTLYAGEWVWEEMTVAQWEAKLAEVNQQEEVVARRKADRNVAVGDRDLALKHLWERSKQVLALARVRFRGDESRAVLFAAVTLRRSAQADVLASAAEVDSAWANADAAWVPLPGVTLAGFRAERQATEAALEAFGQAEAAWRRESETLQTLARGARALCVAWYAAATAIFPATTATGQTIRSQTPTDYSPAAEARRRARREAKAAGGTDTGGTAPGG